jgi:hypothetical protein
VALGPERLFASLLTGSLSALEEIVSSGRSGSFLYRSVDGRYLIKTLPPEEKSFFRQILPSYFDVRLSSLTPTPITTHAHTPHATRHTHARARAEN